MPKQVFIGVALGDDEPQWIPVRRLKVRYLDRPRGRPPGIKPWKYRLALTSLAIKARKQIDDGKAARQAARVLFVDRAEVRRARLEMAEDGLTAIVNLVKTGTIRAFFTNDNSPGRHEGRVDFILDWVPGKPPELSQKPSHVIFRISTQETAE